MARPLRNAFTEARQKSLRNYRWSTYRSYAGEQQRWRWIEYAPLLAMVRGKGVSAGALGMGTGAAASKHLAKCRNRAQSESVCRNLAKRVGRRLKNAVKC